MFANLLSRYWWIIMLRGILAIVFGLIVLAYPGISLASLILLFAAYVFVDGAGNVFHAFEGRHEHEHWWVMLLTGLAGMLVGVLTVGNPGLTALVILFYIAIWAIATGILQIVAAIRLRREIEGEFWMMLGGLVSVLFGMFLMGRPGAGALAILWLIGVYAIVSGIITTSLAFKMRSFVKRVTTAPPRPAMGT
ncbi:HdeD family acid-resistance protein [bacterium]|nr:HdeD family acid-resistance protein [bacterium]